MILQQEKFKDTVSGADSEKEFSIDTDSSVIFEILRDRMYKDKIGSICREVASNSRDANREAGTDKPVEITIISPNRLLSISHPSISFRDYGAGISPKKMDDIYLKYGASDKRTSNKLTGGFGLGAKTPFAYNDTFTVITIVETEGKNIKYTYTAMIDSSGKGKMILFEKGETTEHTGTEVIVPINTSDDRYKFERDILKYTKTWGDEISYKGFVYTQEEMDLAYENEDVVIYKTDNYHSNTMELLIDGIPYPLDTDLIGIRDSIGRSNRYYLTVLKFNTGELNISANRESVQYDDKTVEAIKEKHAKVETLLNKLTKKIIETQETYLEACKLTYYVNRKSSSHENSPALVGAILAHSKTTGYRFKDIYWKGRKTTDHFNFRHHTVYRVSLAYGKNNYEPLRDFHFSENNIKAPIFYGDTRKNAGRNVNVWEEGYNTFFIIKPNNADSKEGLQEFMNFIFKFDLDFKLYSDLEIVKDSTTTKTTYQKKSYVTLNTRTLEKGYWGEYNNFAVSKIALDRKTFEPEDEDLDLSKTLYYKVHTLNSAEYLSKKEGRWLAENKGYTIIVIRNQDYRNWFKNTPIRNAKDVYEEEYAKYEEEVLKKKRTDVLNNLIYKRTNSVIPNTYWEVVGDLLPKVAQNRELVEDISLEDVEIVKKTLKFDFDGLERKIKRIFTERYPMIRMAIKDHSLSKEEKIKNLKLYIKQVNHYYGS